MHSARRHMRVRRCLPRPEHSPGCASVSQHAPKYLAPMKQIKYVKRPITGNEGCFFRRKGRVRMHTCWMTVRSPIRIDKAARGYIDSSGIKELQRWLASL